MSLGIKLNENGGLCVGCNGLIRPGELYACGNEGFPETPEAPICFNCLTKAFEDIVIMQAGLLENHIHNISVDEKEELHA